VENALSNCEAQTRSARTGAFRHRQMLVVFEIFANCAELP